MTDFVEEVLDLGWDYGAAGGLEWSITSTVTGGGQEKRNLNWSQPLGEWQLGDRTKENCLVKDRYEYLYKFWAARQGSLVGFRYKDWGDFELKQETIGAGDGVTTGFQVVKNYGDFTRIIKKIDPLNFFVRVNGLEQPFTVNPNTGVVTFNSAPANGSQIKVTGEFHVPVRFVENKWPGKFYSADPDSGDRWYELRSLQIKAIRA